MIVLPTSLSSYQTEVNLNSHNIKMEFTLWCFIKMTYYV